MCCFACAVTVVSRSRRAAQQAPSTRMDEHNQVPTFQSRSLDSTAACDSLHPDKLRRRSEASQPARAASEAVTCCRTHVLPRLRREVLLAKRIRPTRRTCRSNLSTAHHHRRIIRMRRGSSLYGRRAFRSVPSHRSSSQAVYNSLPGQRFVRPQCCMKRPLGTTRPVS